MRKSIERWFSFLFCFLLFFFLFLFLNLCKELFMRRKRLHEPFVFAACLSTALSLHLVLITNLFESRSDVLRLVFSLSHIGSITGLFFACFLFWLSCFSLCLVFFRGRDLSSFRLDICRFFMVSVIIYLVMTFPPLFLFGIRLS